MAFVMHALALLALTAVANGQFSCPTAYGGKNGNPKCAGSSDSTCSIATCCTLTGELCASTGVITGNTKCKAGSDKNQFFDFKKGASAYLGTDDNFRNTCCTSCSMATCLDWQTAKPLAGCDSGKYFKPSNVLGSSDCSIPSDSKYREGCCAAQAACSSHTCSSGWTKRTGSGSIRCPGDAATCTDAQCCTATMCAATGVITGNTKCKAGTDKNQFFDLKKASSVVGSTDDSFRTTCCTSCSAATCFDWQTVKMVGCSSGKMFSESTTLGSSDCSIPSDSKYKETCCIDIPPPPAPMKCADYVGGEEENASTAFPKAFPVVCTLAGFMALVGAHVVFWA